MPDKTTEVSRLDKLGHSHIQKPPQEVKGGQHCCSPPNAPPTRGWIYSVRRVRTPSGAVRFTDTVLDGPAGLAPVPGSKPAGLIVPTLQTFPPVIAGFIVVAPPVIAGFIVVAVVRARAGTRTDEIYD